MAQKLFEDKIGILTEAGGLITLAPSRLTIGGQQYITTSNLTISANVSSSNTRYQIFAVLSGGVPTLVISQNENSSGPSGYSAWKLVGSYYTNGLLSGIGFGSFVKITGTPTTKDIIHFPLINTNSGTLAAGTGGNATQTGYWSRNGSKITYSFVIRFGTSGIGTGNSNYEIILPGALNRRTNIDGEGGAAFEIFPGSSGTLFDVSASQNYGIVVGAGKTTPSDEMLMLVEERNSTAIVVGPSVPFTFGTDDILRGAFTIEVQEFSDTPIEDL